MPRAPRIEYAGAIYHVMSRGDRLEAIFEDEQDKEIFLKTLEETCQSSGWSIHSFVLMKNHYHLLIETLRPTLVKGMQYLNSTYTRRYNVKHKTFGHLFQGRYKALLVDADNEGYFLTVSDYIHLNPVRSKLIQDVKELLKDPWNSVGWLAGSRKKSPPWLCWQRVYGELGMKDWRSRSRREYRTYLERRVDEIQSGDEVWKQIRRGWCLGSAEFKETMKEKLEELHRKPRDAETWNDPAVEEMEETRAFRWMNQGIKKLGYDRLEEVLGWDRLLIARWVRTYSKVSVKWVAHQLRMKTRGGMSNGIYLVGKMIESDPKTKRRWRQLQNIL